jgi:hypothetical protein
MIIDDWKKLQVFDYEPSEIEKAIILEKKKNGLQDYAIPKLRKTRSKRKNFTEPGMENN